MVLRKKENGFVVNEHTEKFLVPNNKTWFKSTLRKTVLFFQVASCQVLNQDDFGGFDAQSSPVASVPVEVLNGCNL